MQYLYAKIQQKEKLKVVDQHQKILEFKEKLGLDPYKCNLDAQNIICTLQGALEGEIIHTQYYILNKKPNLYFSEYKLAIQIDGYDHVDRYFKYKRERQMIMEKELGCTFIRINPHAADFNVNRVINLLYMYIKQPTKKIID